MSDRVLMKGNEAIGEAAVQAGCQCYFGYPITPQNELIAYMSTRMVEEGRVFIQSESEIAAINMCFGAAAVGVRTMTSSSGPGISLKQEGISYLAGAELPVFFVNVMRGGPGLGNIAPSQADYFQCTRGGGHGDYRTIVFAPSDVQELYDYTLLGFDVADRYRIPTMIAADGILGQMMEPLVLTEYKQPTDLPSKQPWQLGDPSTQEPLWMTSVHLGEGKLEAHNLHLQKKYDLIEANEVRFEETMMDDAEIVIVAYGTSARVAKAAMVKAREAGIKVGMFRPITLWPFPYAPLNALADRIENFLTVEMSLGQMVEDVRLGTCGKSRVHLHGRTAGGVPVEDDIVEQLKKILASKGDEIIRNF